MLASDINAAFVHVFTHRIIAAVQLGLLRCNGNPVDEPHTIAKSNLLELKRGICCDAAHLRLAHVEVTG